MARNIGVQQKWIQGEGTHREHFDICLGLKQRGLFASAGGEWTEMDRRSQILDAIRLYKERHQGNSPTERELADMVGISQPVMHRHLAAMEQAGMISRPGSHRSIQIQPEQLNL